MKPPTKEEIALAKAADDLKFHGQMISFHVAAWLRDPRRDDPAKIRDSIASTIRGCRVAVDALEAATRHRLVLPRRK